MAIENQNSTTLENNFKKILESMKEIIRESMKELQSSMNQEFKQVMKKFDELKASNERGLEVISEMKTSGSDREELKAAEYENEGNDDAYKVFDKRSTRGTSNKKSQFLVMIKMKNCLCVTTTQYQPMYDDSGGRKVDIQVNDWNENDWTTYVHGNKFSKNIISNENWAPKIVNENATIASYMKLSNAIANVGAYFVPKNGEEMSYFPIDGSCEQWENVHTLSLLNGVFTRAWYTLLNYLDPMIISHFDAFHNWKFSYDNMQASGLVKLKIDEMRMFIFDPGGVIYNIMDADNKDSTIGKSQQLEKASKIIEAMKIYYWERTLVRLLHYYANRVYKIHGLTVVPNGLHKVQVLHEPIGVVGEGDLGRWKNGIWSAAVEAPGQGSEALASTLVLAEKRTSRPDILSRFRQYRGGWDIANKHYWASVGYTGAAGFILAVLWFFSFGVVFSVHQCCGWRINIKGKESRSSQQICLIMLIFFTCAAA